MHPCVSEQKRETDRVGLLCSIVGALSKCIHLGIGGIEIMYVYILLCYYYWRIRFIYIIPIGIHIIILWYAYVESGDYWN